MQDGLRTANIKVTYLDATYQSGTQADFTTANLTTGNITTGTVEDLSIGADATFAPGSPYNEGLTFNSWKASAICSGGMWVIGSKGVITPAGASQDGPLGVAKATTASGATCEVLTYGPVYLLADADIVAGVGAKVGAGGALNTVAPAGAGSSVVGVCVTGASSGGKALIFLK